MTPPCDDVRTGWPKGRMLAVAAMVGAALAFFSYSAGALGAPPASLGWSRAGVGAGPSARLHAAMAFDPDTGTTLLFGGRSGSHILGDTWTWDGTAWTLRAPATSPPPLESASATYDDATHQVLLFGGMTPGGAVTDATWAWDGVNWRQLTVTNGPAARFSASLALNPATHAVLMFGGFALPGVPLGDTWSWNGSGWTQENPPSSPAARGGAGTASDPTGVGVVIFGGSTGSEVLGDTWTWNGTTWAQRNPPKAPLPRVDAAMASEPGARAVLLFGGSPGNGLPFTDTWTWDGAAWSQPSLAASRPAGLWGAALGIGPAGDNNVLFGGATNGGSPSGDTWTFGQLTATHDQPASTTTTPSATAPSTTLPPRTTVRPATSSSSATTSTTRAPPPKPQPLAVSARSVHDGDTVTLSGAGFAPGATIAITFHSAPIDVGSTTADQFGRFMVTVEVPAHAAAGRHHFDASGPAPTGGQRVLDAAIGVTVPHGPNSWVLPTVMISLTVLLAAGAAVALARVGRWNQGPAT